jgi:N-methylhydantoinase A
MTMTPEVPTRLVGVDVGGTFTDVMAIVDGEVVASKVPTDLYATETSVLKGAEEVGVSQASVFNLASTAGLNSIITRSLPKIAFLTTYGHRDMLERGRLWRPFEALTNPNWRRGISDGSRPLVPRYLRRNIRERMHANGDVLVPLDAEQARAELELLAECDVQGVAICLLHSYANPSHEIQLRELVHDVLGDVVCSISSEVSPLAQEYPRASTTTVDLLMKLKYTDYTARLEKGLADLGFTGEFNYADCSAQLMPAEYAMDKPHRLVVGGPAAGTVATAHFGTFIKETDLLAADVGGTSCDISVVLNGEPWVNSYFELEWDLVITALSTEIVTLGAGGGSIVAIGRSGELMVGPDSAGATPGPVCYSKGGTAPTLTDAALAIGILMPDRFLGGKVPLDVDLAVDSFERLDSSLVTSERIRQAWLIGLHNIAEGILDLAVRRGIDVRDFSLVACGAAGPMMLPGVLDNLPLKSVIVPPNPGGFSALGLLSADRVYSESKTLYGLIDERNVASISELLERMERELLDRAGVEARNVRVVRTFDARLQGQGWETPFISLPSGSLSAASVAPMVEAFHTEYKRRTGNKFDQFPVEGVTYRVQVIVPSDKVAYHPLESRGGGAVPVAARRALAHLYPDGADANCYERDALRRDDEIVGPAIIWEAMSTTFVPLGRKALVGEYGEIRIS